MHYYGHQSRIWNFSHKPKTYLNHFYQHFLQHLFSFIFIDIAQKKSALLSGNTNEKLHKRKKLPPIYLLSSGEHSAPSSRRTPTLEHPVLSPAYMMTSLHDAIPPCYFFSLNPNTCYSWCCSKMLSISIFSLVPVKHFPCVISSREPLPWGLRLLQRPGGAISGNQPCAFEEDR